MSRVQRGQDVTLTKGYSARGFALAAEEEPAAAFQAFDRAGRAPRLAQVRPGARHTAVTDAGDDGAVYVRIEIDGAPFACLLLPGTYSA